MDSTLRIRIKVRGHVSERLAAAFDGLTLVPCPGGTELVGAVRDQTQLHGLLAHIRDLGLALESVRVVEAQPNEPDTEA